MINDFCKVCGKLLTWEQVAHRAECCSTACWRALEERKKLEEAKKRRKKRMADLGLPDYRER